MSFKKQLIQQRPFLEDLAKRRFIFVQSFEIYGGISGFYDFGPIGSSLKNNIIQLWREEFINQEDLLEISSCNITPEIVFKNSGHLSKFTDLMVLDNKTKEPFRADKLIEEVLNKRLNSKDTKNDKKIKYNDILNKINGFDIDDINKVIKDCEIKSLTTGNELSLAFPFNLMFQTNIGPKGNLKGYLKPETAQGMFLNFKRLLEFNLGKLPFGSAQIGLGFRNEISPRNSLLRVREFDMGEIEYFFDPDNKEFDKFELIKDVKIKILPKNYQIDKKESFEITIENMIKEKYIDNLILGYYWAKTFNFLIKLGINKDYIQFRQHLSSEMAHYSKDCWDAEILTSYGWIECVGHAYRSAYDLECHSKGSGDNLVASKKLTNPIQKNQVIILWNKSILGKKFKKDSQIIFKAIESMNFEEKKNILNQFEKEKKYTLKIEDKTFILEEDCFEKIKEELVTIHEEKIIPHVIEPSFGFGRILYCILEHSFIMRDKKRTFLKLSPLISPIKVVILPLISKEEILKKCNEVYMIFKKNSITVKKEVSNLSIGRRYARTEEIGIPFGITIDFDTLEDNTITLRESESMSQLRIPINDILTIIQNLCSLKIKFNDLKEQYKNVETKE